MRSRSPKRIDTGSPWCSRGSAISSIEGGRKMRVLVIGSGGREHVLVWKLRQSPRVSRVYAAPGNGGMAEGAECLPFSATAVDELVRFAEEEGIDLTVVGPEAPLLSGLVDRFEERGLKVFG